MLQTESRIENLPTVKDWAEECWLNSGFPTDRIDMMLLCIEEAFANVCLHGYKNIRGLIRLECSMDKKGSLIFKIIDWAAPFDVTQVAPPDTGIALRDRKIGGLGVMMVREMADEVHWNLENNANVLSLKFNLTNTVTKERGNVSKKE